MSESSHNANDPYALQPDLSQQGERSPLPTVEASPEPEAEPQSAIAWMLLKELVETVVLSLIIFLLIRLVVQNYRIESHSMEPNFTEGQFILVNKLAYKLGTPERGEVLVFHNPQNLEEDFIKRIIGLPGDTLEIHDNQVWINGKLLEEPFERGEYTPGYVFGPVTVPPNHLFVMGDNRGNSRDSRFPDVGPIDESLVVGEAWLRVWPFSVFGLVRHYHLEPGAPVAQAP